MISDILGNTFKKKHELQLNGENEFSNHVNTKINLFKRNNENPIQIFSDSVKSDRINFEQSANNFLVTTDYLKEIIHKSKNKISTWVDNIPNIIIKNLTDNLIRKYVIIFNNALNNGYLPNAWKTAKLITICKPGKDPTNPNNYRPISLLPNISKIFEKCINKNMICLSIWVPTQSFDGTRH